MSLKFVPEILRAMRRNPRLMRWWVRNRLRQATLARDYRFRSDGWSRPPRSVSLRPTFLCNHNCMMCSFANSASATGDTFYTRDAEMMSLDLAKRLVDDLAPTRTCITVTGGEPYLWPHLFEVIEYAHSKGAPITVTTNGSLLVKRFDEFREAQIAGLKHGGRFSPPMMVINTPMLMENAEQFHELIQITADLPIAANHYQHLWFTTPTMRERMSHAGTEFESSYTESMAIDTESIDPTCVWEGICRAREVASDRPVVFYPELSRRDVETYYQRPEQLVLRKRAICAWIFTHVLPNGDVTPCLGVVGGNLNEHSFPEVWNSEAFREFRRALRERGTLPICSRCCVFFRKD